MEAKKLGDFVEKLLTEKFSGGAKFLEILPHLIEPFRNEFPSDTDFLDEVINCLKLHHNLQVVEYEWNMGGSVARQKFFICTCYNRS